MKKGKLAKVKVKKLKPAKVWKIKTPWLVIIILIVLAGGAFYAFIYKQSCETRDCFIRAFWNCRPATWTNAQELSTWEYIIKGKAGEVCKVSVRNIEAKTDVETAKALKDKAMLCEIPKELWGSFMPEEKIEYCHGILKEAIQDLIIQKMHLFIVQNIGQINKTAMKPL